MLLRSDTETVIGIYTAGFWSRWLLWSYPDLEKSKKFISKKFGFSFSLIPRFLRLAFKAVIKFARMFRFMGRGGTGGAGGIGGGAGTRLIGSGVDGFLTGVLGLGTRTGASMF